MDHTFLKFGFYQNNFNLEGTRDIMSMLVDDICL